MALQPIALYSVPFGPNPWKVAIILEELSIPYETTAIWDYTELKKPPYTDLNPNGRAPAIKDPNCGIELWESCAIIEYLVEKYDTENKLNYTSSPEKYLLKQWLYFQASGQGPYYGQAAWFNHFHPEKVPSVQKRYMDELKRVVGVLDGVLAKSASGWLVGDKCTYADLAFFMWDEQIEMVMASFPEEWDAANFPHHKKWHGCIMDRPAVKKIVDEKAKLLSSAKQ